MIDASQLHQRFRHVVDELGTFGFESDEIDSFLNMAVNDLFSLFFPRSSVDQQTTVGVLESSPTYGMYLEPHKHFASGVMSGYYLPFADIVTAVNNPSLTVSSLHGIISPSANGNIAKYRPSHAYGKQISMRFYRLECEPLWTVRRGGVEFSVPNANWTLYAISRPATISLGATDCDMHPEMENKIVSLAAKRAMISVGDYEKADKILII